MFSAHLLVQLAPPFPFRNLPASCLVSLGGIAAASFPAQVQAGSGHMAQAASHAPAQDLQCWVSGRPLIRRTASHTSACPGLGLGRHRETRGWFGRRGEAARACCAHCPGRGERGRRRHLHLVGAVAASLVEVASELCFAGFKVRAERRGEEPEGSREASPSSPECPPGGTSAGRSAEAGSRLGPGLVPRPCTCSLVWRVLSTLTFSMPFALTFTVWTLQSSSARGND